MFKKAIALTLIFSSFSLSAFAQESEERLVMNSGDSGSRNWTASLFSIASLPNMSFGKKASSDRSIGSYNYVGLNTRIDGDSKFSVRIPFVFNTSGQNEYGDQESSVLDLQDVHVAYSNYNLGYIGDLEMWGVAKLYLPTSAYSQNSKMVARLRFEFNVEYPLGRFSMIRYVAKPDIFWQRQTAYFDPETPQYSDGGYKLEPRKTTKQYSLDHYLEAILDINKYFSVKPRAGFDEDWYYSSSAEDLEGSHVTKVYGSIGVEARPVRGWKFTLGVTNKTTLGSFKGKDVAFGQPENTEYYLMTNGSLF